MVMGPRERGRQGPMIRAWCKPAARSRGGERRQMGVSGRGQMQERRQGEVRGEASEQARRQVYLTHIERKDDEQMLTAK